MRGVALRRSPPQAVVVVLTDIDECVERDAVCTNGQCLNLIGSFSCVCRNGYRLSPQKDQCLGESQHLQTVSTEGPVSR